jgi:hypothetical protein
MIQKFKSASRENCTSLYVASCVALVSVMTMTLPAIAEAKKKGGGYHLPCNEILQKPTKSASDPLFGSIVGMKPVFFTVGVVALLIGIVAVISDFGRAFLRYGLIVVGALMFFGSFVTAAGNGYGAAAGC